MAKIIENPKGFKVIEVSMEEIQKKFGGFGICDLCNCFANKHLYIAALDSCYCEDCYEKWTERAKFYKEDMHFENKVFERRKQELGI